MKTTTKSQSKAATLRKAAKLVLTPQFNFNWENCTQCLIGAIYEAKYGKPISVVEYLYNRIEGFTFDELWKAETLNSDKILKRTGLNRTNGRYLNKESVAKYLNAWADILLKK